MRALCEGKTVEIQRLVRHIVRRCLLYCVNDFIETTEYQQVNQKPASCALLRLHSQCSKACALIYKPLCGIRQNERVTFSSDCVFWNENCRNPDYREFGYTVKPKKNCTYLYFCLFRMAKTVRWPVQTSKCSMNYGINASEQIIFD